MKIQQIQKNNIQNNKQEPSFKSVSGVLRYLATNQAVGANAVDLGFMVIPRTGTDLVNRGPAAGLETGRREASGTLNHSLIGVYGSIAGGIIGLAMGTDRKFGTKVNDVMAAPETVNILAENKANQFRKNTKQFDYLKETFANVKAYNPTSAKADKEGFIKLSEQVVDDIAKIVDNAVDSGAFKAWNDKKASNSLQVAMNKIIADTGAESKFVLQSADGKIKSETSLKTLLEDVFKVSESFNKENVQKAFKEQVKNGKKVAENDFIKSLTKFNKGKAALGFAIGSAIGMSIQPINIYLTKKKTGSDGFVGVEGRSKDNSVGFKVLKGVAGAGFGAMTLATLGTGLKGFMEKMAFKDFWPTISQLKGIYGLTIISRILATRDKDELREALTKDTLGFLSWLVLGDIVNRMTAEGLDKSVMNRTKDVANQGFFKRVFHSKLKTRDEVLIETLANNGIDVVKKDGDKTVAKTFGELRKDLEKLPENVKKVAKKRLGTLNKAQLAGYAFSGLVLGLGIPNLNIYITNTLDKKRKEKAMQESA